MQPRHDDELRGLLQTADPHLRRLFACDCAERAVERAIERTGEIVPERAVLAATCAVIRGADGALRDTTNLIAYAARHPSPARDIAATLAVAVGELCDPWELIELTFELCANADDADDERRWMRGRVHSYLANADRTVIPPSVQRPTTRG